MKRLSNSSRSARIGFFSFVAALCLSSTQVAAVAASPSNGAVCKASERNRTVTEKGAVLRCVASDSGFTWRRAPGKASKEDLAALVGTWKTISGSQAGYRMREVFVGGAAKSEAVGRTSDVSGTVILEATKGALQVRSVGVTVGTPGLKSDKPDRDAWLQQKALQTAVYLSARFESTEPLVIIPVPKDGETLSIEFSGRLTLHGVTKPVVLAVEARRTGDILDVVGSARVLLADFKIEAPVVPGIVSADDTGLLEFSLVLKR
jgi:polyisoprenoid-binding protein YceI